MEKHIRLFNKDASNTNASIFGEHSGLLYWDEQDPAWYDLYSVLTENFWIAKEVNLTSDITDWNSKMTEKEKELYKRGISQLVLLDSVATSIDGEFASYIRNPAVKAIMSYIASQEAIHNESYTYIATTFLTKEEAQEVFDRPKTDVLIQKATDLILDRFENFSKAPTKLNMVEALVAMAALEGIRFTNGFTPFYLLNRNKKMLGTGQIITLIQRDELQHSYFQTLVVRTILAELDSTLSEKEKTEIGLSTYEFFKEVVDAEKELAKDMYKDIDGVNVTEILTYIEWRANLLLQNLGLTKIFPTEENPMRWVMAFSPETINNTRTDFFEKRSVNYSKVADFDDL